MLHTRFSHKGKCFRRFTDN